MTKTTRRIGKSGTGRFGFHKYKNLSKADAKADKELFLLKNIIKKEDSIIRKMGKIKEGRNRWNTRKWEMKTARTKMYNGREGSDSEQEELDLEQEELYQRLQARGTSTPTSTLAGIIAPATEKVIDDQVSFIQNLFIDMRHNQGLDDNEKTYLWAYWKAKADAFASTTTPGPLPQLPSGAVSPITPTHRTPFNYYKIQFGKRWNHINDSTFSDSQKIEIFNKVKIILNT